MKLLDFDACVNTLEADELAGETTGEAIDSTGEMGMSAGGLKSGGGGGGEDIDPAR